MNSKAKKMLVALSAFQVSSSALVSEAQAMDIRNGVVKVSKSQVCKIEKFLVVKALTDIKDNKKYSNNPQVVKDDTIETIIKKVNHQYTDINEVLSKGLNSEGYYDEYPHKLSDYFSSGGCTQSWE